MSVMNKTRSLKLQYNTNVWNERQLADNFLLLYVAWELVGLKAPQELLAKAGIAPEKEVLCVKEDIKEGYIIDNSLVLYAM